GRKTLTTVQGIADDYDKKKLVKAFKKVMSSEGGWIPGPRPGKPFCSPTSNCGLLPGFQTEM
ncbi:hypothetical protein ACQP3F_33405, partial [Escherichia coli]